MVLSAVRLAGLMSWCSRSICLDILSPGSSHILLFFLFPLSFQPVNFISSFYKLKLPHGFFKPPFFFFYLNLDFYSCSMFPFTIMCSNWEYCQLSKYPSPDEASFTSLVTLPGFFTTTTASLLLFIIHVSSSSSCLNLGCLGVFFRLFFTWLLWRHWGALATREQQHTLRGKVFFFFLWREAK